MRKWLCQAAHSADVGGRQQSWGPGTDPAWASIDFPKMMLPHTEQEANWATGMQQGASRRDFKDKEEPAKLREQANTDSCVKCR